MRDSLETGDQMFLHVSHDLSALDPCRYDAAGGPTADKQVANVLTGLGFSLDQYDKKCSEFSGGWQVGAESTLRLLAAQRVRGYRPRQRVQWRLAGGMGLLAAQSVGWYRPGLVGLHARGTRAGYTQEQMRLDPHRLKRLK